MLISAGSFKKQITKKQISNKHQMGPLRKVKKHVIARYEAIS